MGPLMPISDLSMLPLSRAFELVVYSGDLRLLCRLAQLSDVVEEAVLEAFFCRRALLRVYFQHALK